MELRFNRLLIIDGSHMLHRSIEQINLWDMIDLNGRRTGGIFGTLNSILKETSKYNYFPVVVFDGHLSKRRLEIYDNYKKAKDKQLLLENDRILTDAEELVNLKRAEYNSQREVLKDLLKAFGLPVLHLSDWEGDDIIYILSQITKDSIIVSDDKDMLQMICDDNERRCRVRRGMRDEFWDLKTLNDMGIDQMEYIACKAICGDTSDNIPSACFGVGEKTALGLYKIYEHSKTVATGFPQDEKALAEICKFLNISKRKAYLDFDENQFLTNILLMDLRLVYDDITSDVLADIYDCICNRESDMNYEQVCNILNELQIKSFNSNGLVNNINRTKNYIFIDSVDKTLNVPDEVQPLGRLF